MTPQIQKLLDDARTWADNQYMEKGGQEGTDLYYKNKHRAMIELLMHIEKTQTESRPNGQL
jgi:hypothetical protein